MARLPLAVLLPTLAGLVACGGAVTDVGASSSGASGSPSGTSSSGGPSGSSGGSTSGSLPTTSPSFALNESLCQLGETRRPLAGVLGGAAPGAGPWSFELREHNPNTDGPDRVIDREGEACKFAPEPTACLAQLASARSEGWSMYCDGDCMQLRRYAVATTMGKVLVAGTVAELTSLLTPVTRAPEAALIVTADGKYRIVCDGSSHARVEPDRVLVRAQSGFACGAGTKVEEHIVAVANDGSTSILSTTTVEVGEDNCAIGRKPQGLVVPRERVVCDDVVGRFFAAAAHLEAASVVSFERLARELESLGAPQALSDAARAGAADEVRHTQATTGLARRFGAEPMTPEVDEPGERGVFAIALENAIEGCVRETYGALAAHWQARHAGDLRIRAAMRVIAEDETRHAELSWAVASFLDTMLTGAERVAIASARAEAVAALAEELEVEPAAALVTTAGMPTARDARALLLALDASHLRAAA